MAQPYVKSGGTWSPVKYIWIKQSGVWTKVKAQYAYNNGAWVKTFPPFDQTSTNDTYYPTAGTYTFTVPNGLSYLYIAAMSAGGGSGAYHDGGYGQHAMCGGVGGGAVIPALPVTAGDVITMTVGTAGGPGHYAGNDNWGLGASGTSTIVYQNGNTVMTCNPGTTGPGAQTSGSASISIGSGTVYTGVSMTTLLNTSDNNPPSGDHYDPWSWYRNNPPLVSLNVYGSQAVSMPAYPLNGLGGQPGIVLLRYGNAIHP